MNLPDIAIRLHAIHKELADIDRKVLTQALHEDAFLAWQLGRLQAATSAASNAVHHAAVYADLAAKREGQSA